MVKVIAKLTIKPGTNQIFLEAFEGLTNESRKEAACISYNLYQDLKNENVYYTVEEWQSEEGLQQHMHAPHFKAASKSFADALACKPELSTCKEVF